MSDTTQPTDWNSLQQFLQEKNDSISASLLYNYAAEEHGKKFEDMYDAIKDISDKYNLSLSPHVISDIWKSAPLLF